MSRYILLLMAGFLFICGHARAQYSYLDNINCGGNKSTCFQSGSGANGDVSCSCTAHCLPKGCPSKSVSASRRFVWGDTVLPFEKPCTLAITATATGGTMIPPNPTINGYTAVFAQVTATEVLVGNLGTYKDIDDCFQGIIENDRSTFSLLC